MNKVEKLTPQEHESIIKFIGLSVWGNQSFPGRTLGVQNVTVQELVNYSISQLENYGEFIEKQSIGSSSSFKSKKGPVKYGNTLASDLINFLHLIIKQKEYEKHLNSLKKKLDEVQESLEIAKTPEERKQELVAEKANLEKELAEIG